MSDVTDWTELGIIPLQHHDPSFTVAGRRRLSAVRVHPRDGNNYTPGQQTYGDVQGGLLWLEQSGKREYLHSWWIGAAPAVAIAGGGGSSDPGGTRTRTPEIPIDFGGESAFGPLGGQGGAGGGGGGGSLWSPIRSSGAVADDRYQLKAPSQPTWAAPTVFPKGWTSLVTSGTDEQKQHENLHPDFWGLVAVNKAGDPDAGTPVYDLSKDGTPERWARLQSAWSVVEFSDKTTALAWQLGKGGRIDGGSGSGMVADHTSNEVGYATSRKGGPWLVGGARGCAIHALTKDADGKTVRPIHNDIGALWILDGARDGPLAFEPQFYDKEALELPVKTRCHLRFDPGNPALGTVGIWRWQASCAFYIPLDPIEDPPPQPPPGGDPPPPPPPQPPPPRGDPPPFIPPGPGGIGTVGGGFLPGGGTQTGGPGFGTGFPTGFPGDEFTIPGGGGTGGNTGSGEPPDAPNPLDGVDISNEPLPPISTGGGGRGSFIDQFTGAINPLKPFGGGRFTGTPVEGSGSGVGVAGGAQNGTPVIGGQGKPTYPTSPNCIAVPNVMFKGVATAAGELNITGAPVQTAQTIATFDAAPHVAHLAAIPAGDGTWAGISSTPGSSTTHPTATGMVMLLPADVTVNQVASGTATTAAPAQISVPTGLSEISFGTPNTTTGRTGSGATCKGYAGGLLIGTTDGDGELVAGGPSMLIGEGGTDFTGNVSISGKLDVAGRLDPTTLELIDQTTDAIPDGSAGFRFNSASNARPIWKQKDSPYTQGPLALYSDITAAASKTRLLYGTEQATGTSLTYSMPAGTMDSDGDVLVIYGRGETGSAFGVDPIRLRLGSTTLFTQAMGSPDDPWEFTARIIRTGSAAQTVYRTIVTALGTGNGTVISSPGTRITATEDLTGALDIILDYSSSGDSDRIVHYLEIELREAP